MAFTHPFALLWGLLAIPVGILGLWRIARRREETGAGMLWEQALAAERARAAWGPWRRPVSLAVELLAVLLVVLALADPQVPRPRRVVVILDNSGSMNAVDVKPSRLGQAKECASRLIAGIRACDRMALIAAGGTVAVYGNLSHDRLALQRGLRSIPATQGPARLEAGVALARRILGDGPGGEVIVISDGCCPAASELADRGDVQLMRVGRPAANMALTRLAARRGGRDPRICQILIEVCSFSEPPGRRRLEISFNGQPLDTVAVGPFQENRWQRVFQTTTSGSGRLSARLQPPDVYPVDDGLSTDLPPAGLRHVVLLTEGNAYLESALEADPSVELELPEKLPSPMPKGAILACDRRLPSPLPRGPILVVAPEESCELWRLGDPLEEPTVAGQQEDSPVLEGLCLVGLGLGGARRLELTEKAAAAGRPLAWAADGAPLILAIERPGARAVIVAGNLQAGSLARTSVLPILISSAIHWLQGEELRVGAERTGAVPSAREARSTEADLRVPGGLGVEATAVAAGRPGPPPRLYLVAVAVLLLFVQWCLYQRRWIC